jgi:hypothetical protein
MVQGSMFKVQGFANRQLFSVCNPQSAVCSPQSLVCSLKSSVGNLGFAVLGFLLPTADCQLPIFKVYSHHSAICNFFLLIADCLLPTADFYKSK